MKTIEPMAGDDLYDVLCEAVENAPARFTFNEWEFETRVGEALRDARQRFKQEHNFEVLTPEQNAAKAARYIEETKTKQAADIKAAGVPTEKQLRQGKAPHPETIEQLSAYVQSLVDRPHDYGTCVYAMSYAAVAAFNFVAHKLGVTGFQASCADMDILRQTRGWEWGRLLDYADLLYPQYCDEYHFPSPEMLLNDAEVRPRLREMANQKLRESPDAAPGVVAHWKRLAS